jgi:hypothetical protein
LRLADETPVLRLCLLPGGCTKVTPLEPHPTEIMCKLKPPIAPGRRFAKDEFAIDLQAGKLPVRPARSPRCGPLSRGSSNKFVGVPVPLHLAESVILLAEHQDRSTSTFARRTETLRCCAVSWACAVDPQSAPSAPVGSPVVNTVQALATTAVAPARG